jgi:5,10-methylenetetrahydromethanopterin reductase
LDVGIVLNGRRTASEIGALAGLAEQNGISHLWLSGGSRTKDHFLRLAIAAGHTSRLLLGPVAISPFEMHPSRIAISLLTLDETLNGRACIVLGGGGDFAKTLGLPLKHPVEAVAETIDIIRQLAKGGEVNFDGELFKVKGLHSPWSTRPSPPLYVGANKPKMIRMSAKKADGIMFTDMPLAHITSLIRQVQENLDTSNRGRKPFRLSNWFAWNVQETEEEALRIAHRNLGFRLYYIRDVAQSIGLDSATADELARMQHRMIRAVFENREVELPSEKVTQLLIDHLTMTGSKQSLGRHVQTLLGFEKRGLNEIALALQGDPVASIKMLGTHVVPLLARNK